MAYLFLVRSHDVPLRIAIYIVTIVAGLLPIIFRGHYWLRVVCAVALSLVALQHVFFLDIESRLVSDYASAKNGGRRPADFNSALPAIREVNHSEEPLTALVFVAFALLVLVPHRRA